MEKNKKRKPIRPVREQARMVNQTKHRKRNKKNYILHYALLFVLVAVTGVILSVTVFFNIKEIVVEGNVTHTTEDVIAYAQTAVGDNLFRVNLTEAEDRVLKNTIDLDSVVIQRRLPDKLGIVVKQATPAATYKNGSDYFIISTSGRIIAQTPTLDNYENLLQFDGSKMTTYGLGDFVQEVEEYQIVQTVVDAIQAVGFEQVASMEVSSAQEIKLCYDNRITIQLGSVLELEYKLQMVKKVIGDYVESEEGLVDARKPAIAYFRPMSMEVQIADGKAVMVSTEVTPPATEPAPDLEADSTASSPEGVESGSTPVTQDG